MERLMTTEEVATYLRLSPEKNKAVYAYRKKGLLPGIKVGTQYLFKETDVIEFVEKLYRSQNK